MCNCSMSHFHEDLDRDGSTVLEAAKEKKADYTTDTYDESN